MADPRLVRAASPREFFERCRPWLLASEAEHNLILGLEPGLRSGRHDFEPPLYLAWVEDDAGVRGIAFRTPPFKVGVSRLPPAVVPALVTDLGGVYDAIPAVMGPGDTAEAVARAWAGPRGLAVRTGMRLRIHELTALRPGPPRPAGSMRRGRTDDVPRVAEWTAAFSGETGIPDTDPSARARRVVEEGRLRVWEVGGEVVSMAAWAGVTETAVRVGYVYTPPEARGRGFATALVTDLSAEVLATGRRSAFLYTDLANPTSNAIYARIGYQPVCDVVDVEIDGG